jgi:hypothetical protein
MACITDSQERNSAVFRGWFCCSRCSECRGGTSRSVGEPRRLACMGARFKRGQKSREGAGSTLVASELFFFFPFPVSFGAGILVVV